MTERPKPQTWEEFDQRLQAVIAGLSEQYCAYCRELTTVAPTSPIVAPNDLIEHHLHTTLGNPRRNKPPVGKPVQTLQRLEAYIDKEWLKRDMLRKINPQFPQMGDLAFALRQRADVTIALANCSQEACYQHENVHATAERIVDDAADLFKREYERLLLPGASILGVIESLKPCLMASLALPESGSAQPVADVSILKLLALQNAQSISEIDETAKNFGVSFPFDVQSVMQVVNIANSKVDPDYAQELKEPRGYYAKTGDGPTRETGGGRWVNRHRGHTRGG